MSAHRILIRVGSRTAVILLWVSLWQLLTHVSDASTALLPGPAAVLRTMLEGRFVHESVLPTLVPTTLWVLGGWLTGLAICLALSVMSSYCQPTEPLVALPAAVGRTLPSVIAIPLFAASFRSGRLAVLACATALVVAYSFPTLAQSLRTARAAWAAIAGAVRLRFGQTLAAVALPAVAAALAATAAQSLGIALVVTVAGEMILVVPGSLGARVSDWYFVLRMREMYALVAWLVIAAATMTLSTHILGQMLRLPGRLMVRSASARLSQHGM